MGRKKTDFQWTRDEGEEAWEPAERRNREDEKEFNQRLEDLTKQLGSMVRAQLMRLPISPELVDEIVDYARQHPKSSRRRQLLRVQHYLRKVDLDAIDRALAGDTDEAAELRELERWRTRLISEGDAALQDFLDAFPGRDRQQLRTLIRTANGEGAAAKKAARRLFQAMKGDG